MFYQKESLDGSNVEGSVTLKVESIPSVSLRCKICEAGITNHKVGCSTRMVLYPFEGYAFEPGNEKSDKEYLWLVNYFHKYKEGSVWGEWIKDSLDMKVMYSDTK